ncbi:hypothetical protein Tco_1500504 [Tanacetum coccineum]
MKAKTLRKTIAFMEGSDNSKLMEKMEALMTKIDSPFKEIKKEMKELQNGCNKCRGPHRSSEYDDKPKGGPEEEANYIYEGYREGGYRGNYYVEQGQKNHQAAIQDLETKFGRFSDQHSTRLTSSLSSNTQTNPKPSPSNDKPYRPPPAQNEHVNAVFTRSSKTYDPPVNPNDKNSIIYDDREVEADETKRVEEPSSSKLTQSEPPLKSTWMAFGGNTHDLGSFWEEMDEIATLHQSQRRKATQWLEMASQILATASGYACDGVRILVTASECN